MRKKTLYLLLGILSNFGLLFIFKYLHFFSSISHYTSSSLSLMIPLGLSFHTFQGVSYLIEVYKKRQKAEKNIFLYSLYVLFFPQLIAGPIERPQHLLKQLHQRYTFKYTRVVDGLRLILWGLFKKVAIADHIARIIDPVFANPSEFSGYYLLFSILLFSYQIYCDFSGYIDIARGSASLFGITLIENFDNPYRALSVSDFWKRWNISLSSWFRDYVYIPMGGNRVSLGKTVRNLFITFLLSGLWHGANMTFVVWGLLHGLYISVEYIITSFLRSRNISIHFPSFLKRISVFFLISLTWIFFRSSSVEQALYILNKIVISLFGNLPNQLSSFKQTLSQNKAEILTVFFFIILLEFVQTYKNILPYTIRSSIIIRWIFYLFLLWAIIFSGEFGRKEFIYFVF